jgi:phthiocerol/phenolphthiocerol synthesis type-I polyketide synthase E
MKERTGLSNYNGNNDPRHSKEFLMNTPEFTSPGDTTGLEIAVIGLAGRFPNAHTIEQFWQNLCDAANTLTFFSDQALAEAGVDPALLHDQAYVKAGMILNDIDKFDAPFFGIPPREAEITDPQQRLFLECVWEALEHAGYDPEAYSGMIGLYAGSRLSNYFFSNLTSRSDIMAAVGRYQAMLNNDRDFLATRVSYKLNLKGPSLTVQTACSTSLVAVHLACQALLSGTCDIALAGGVAIMVPQTSGYRYQEDGILSPDGYCRAFDAQAQGTVGGNGLGVVVLKRLEDALNDNDQIYAVIKGSAINNDGAAKLGYTAPSVEGQAEVIRTAQMIAEVNPDTISYIEAHGTGTALGDPVEVEALSLAFRAHTDRKNFCAIGSVKTNIGHLDAAAGVTGLIKTVLMLHHKHIPASLHFERPNPRIDFANSPFYVNTQLREWLTDGAARRAGVSSFGIGGTNAHIVLEEAPSQEPSGPSRSAHMFMLSARTSTALDAATANLAAYLKHHPTAPLADVAYTLQVGRRAFSHRRMLVCSDAAEAIALLETVDAQRVLTQEQVQKDRSVTFMFSGQGSQYINMGRALWETEAFFREQVDRCAELLKPHLGLDLRTVLYPSAEGAKVAEQQLQQTWIAQPALFTIEYALAQLWIAWGIRPQAMIGHSIGEYVAACLADVISLEDALHLVALRGRLMQELPPGAMLHVALAPEEAQKLLGTALSLAAVNAPNHCVIAGPTEEIKALEQQLKAQNIKSRQIHTSHAFHSVMMEPICAPFVEHLKRIRLHPPKLPFVSTFTGTWITATEATNPGYWADHLRNTVRFADGLQTLATRSKGIFLEIGPGTTLTMLAQQQLPPAEHRALASLRHPQDSEHDVTFLLQTLGQLWLSGLQVDWASFYADERRQRLALPSYPFERKRYWIDPASTVSNRAESTPAVLPTSTSVPASATMESVTLLDEDPAIADVLSKQLEIMQQQLAYLATNF